MCVYRAMACVVLCGALSMEPETRNQTLLFRPGSVVNLTCTNKTWSDLFYVIWTIRTAMSRVCVVNRSDDGQNQNSCDGGPALLNTSRGEPYLHLPRLSGRDEGLYRCDVSYRRGGVNANIHLGLYVPPTVTAQVEERGGGRVVVCVAEGGRPAAALSWRYARNLTTPAAAVTTETLNNSYVTVRSVLGLAEGGAPQDVSCVAVHPAWDGEVSVTPEEHGGAQGVLWVWLLVCGLVLVPSLVALCLVQMTRAAIRRCWRWVCQTVQEPAPPATGPEDLQPYASYVQRDNAIYCSSADLLS